MDAIDLVISWVDGADPIHEEERAKYLRIYKSRDNTAIASYRWTNHNELYFCVLSALRFAPWLRYIFIVVSLGQRPEARVLNLDSRIRVIDDILLLPDQALPTFNSHAIEANLWRIPDLSERFLYANDDEMFASPVEPTDFFDAKTGHPRLIPGDLLPVVVKQPHDLLPGWYAARCNNSLLLNRFFGPSIPLRREAKHQIRPVLKSIFQGMWGIGGIRKALEKTTFSRFRHHQNVEPIGLAQQCAIQWGKRAPAGNLHCCYISWYDNVDWDTEFQKLRQRKPVPHLLCINDEQKEHIPESAFKLSQHLEAWFRVPPENQECRLYPESIALVCETETTDINKV